MERDDSAETANARVTIMRIVTPPSFGAVGLGFTVRTITTDEGHGVTSSLEQLRRLAKGGTHR
jgi:hypothetical protein